MSKIQRKLRRTVKSALIGSLPYGLSIRLFPPHAITEPNPPHVYNSKGERMLIAYMQDQYIAHSPYSWVTGRMPSRILWDRYNRELPTQFYTHQDIFKIRPGGGKKFGAIVEPETIVPDVYKQAIKRGDIIKGLDGIFTHSEILLDKYPNAMFFPGNGVWYGTEKHGGVMDVSKRFRKSKALSIVASKKNVSPLHILRGNVALEMQRSGIGDVMGAIVGRYVALEDFLTDYMFSVSIENLRAKYYFTEKILNCFASMTIPVYYGASEISKFFNPDGILFIKEPTVKCVMETLRQCNRDEYENREAAVIDNFNRVQEFLSIEDYLTSHYMDKFDF